VTESGFRFRSGAFIGLGRRTPVKRLWPVTSILVRVSLVHARQRDVTNQHNREVSEATTAGSKRFRSKEHSTDRGSIRKVRPDRSNQKGTLSLSADLTFLTAGHRVVNCAGRQPMTMSHFQTVLTVALLLPFSAVPFAPTPRQSVKQDSASVTINPHEATVHVGQTQTFEAVVTGTRSTGIRWTIAERDGGRISEDGIYTAPRHLGLYHVVATSEENPTARAFAKVTVVTEYDSPDSQKLR
jgi:hypothetical protein